MTLASVLLVVDSAQRGIQHVSNASPSSDRVWELLEDIKKRKRKRVNWFHLKKEELVALLYKYPGATYSELADIVGCSKKTIYNRMRELKDSGVLDEIYTALRDVELAVDCGYEEFCQRPEIKRFIQYQQAKGVKKYTTQLIHVLHKFTNKLRKYPISWSEEQIRVILSLVNNSGLASYRFKQALKYFFESQEKWHLSKNPLLKLSSQVYLTLKTSIS